MTRKLFGTDGVRGRANTYPMTAEMAMAVMFGPSLTMMRSWLAGGAKPRGVAQKMSDAAVRSLVKGKSR